MSLTQKTVSGLKWSFADSFITYSIQFVIGLVLARLLEPSEFGLIGMMTFFISISQAFIDSGFSHALIRKKNVNNLDFSTVFYFNMAVSLVFYFILFIFSSEIGRFYNEPVLSGLIKVLGITLLINAVTIVQRTSLIKDINFKLQAKISLVAAIISGGISIYLAWSGAGVWSLVWKTLIQSTIISFFLWYSSRIKIICSFSLRSFRELFDFGYKLLFSGLIDSAYKNIYYLIIGKVFSAAELGFYTRADQFNNFPSSTLTNIIQRVSYPVLSTLQDQPGRLKEAYKKLIRNTMFISSVLMLGMAGAADNIIIALIGEKWQPSIPFLRLLCFIGLIYPLHALNLNILKVMGKSNLFLRIEIIKKLLAVPVIVVGVFLGIKAMITAMIIHSIIALYINSYWSRHLIKYEMYEQIMDIVPGLLVAMISSVIIYFTGYISFDNYLLKLFCQFITGIISTITLAELVRIKPYLDIKNLIIDELKNWKTGTLITR